MKKFVCIGVFLASLLVSHKIILQVTPKAIMTKAMGVMEQRGVPVHGFAMSPRITPQTQLTSRPSPDLAYSLCLFDVSGGPVVVTGAKWARYGSLTIFNGATDVVYMASLDTANDNANNVALTTNTNLSLGDDTPIVYLKNPKGIALIRRLAPTNALYNKVVALSKGDTCTSLNNEL